MAATTFELPNRERRTSVRSLRSPPTYRLQPVVVQFSGEIGSLILPVNGRPERAYDVRQNLVLDEYLFRNGYLIHDTSPDAAQTKKDDVAEHPEVFHHVGLLLNGPSSEIGLPFS